MAVKPHTNSILKDLLLCAWDPKDVAEGNRSELQPDVDGNVRWNCTPHIPVAWVDKWSSFPHNYGLGHTQRPKVVFNNLSRYKAECHPMGRQFLTEV